MPWADFVGSFHESLRLSILRAQSVLSSTWSARTMELPARVRWPVSWSHLLGAGRPVDFPRRNSCVKKGGWGELADNTVRCEARAMVVRTFNPNSVFWIWSACLDDTFLTANVLQDSWKGPWDFPGCNRFFKHTATVQYVVSWRDTRLLFSPQCPVEKFHLRIKVLPYGTWFNFSFNVKVV